MERIIHYLIIIICAIATYLLYNKQLGAIPLLILALYLFYCVYRSVKRQKKDN